MVKLLVVDDDPDMVNVIQFRLKHAGYECVIANSGKEALEKFSPDIDIVVLDIQMPEMDGFEVAKQLPKELPIVFLTGKIDFPKDNLPQREKMSFVIKPCDFSDLINHIQTLQG